MSYSEIFADPADNRVRILGEIAEEIKQARLHEYRALELLAELRDEPDKIVARELVEALRIDPKKASLMLTGATAITEILTPTGHITPAPLPTVRESRPAVRVS